MKEIDLLIEQDGIIHPIEIKKHSDPTKKDISAFKVLDNFQEVRRGSGGIICAYDNLTPICEADKVIPVRSVMEKIAAINNASYYPDDS